MKNRLIIIFFLAFFFFDIIFNFGLVKEIINPGNKVPIGDGITNELLTETGYQNLIRFKNPFASNDKIFYPFKINYSIDDTTTVNILPLILLRPFFDIHRATLVIVLVNIFLANVLMYLLLRKLKITKIIAFVISLVFGFSPFISYRVLGHYSYTITYIFPLIFLNALLFIEATSFKKKILYSVTFGFFTAFSYLANPYSFLAIIIAILLYLIYYFAFYFRQAIGFLKEKKVYLFFSFVIFIVTLVPRFQQMWEYSYFRKQIHIRSFEGAVELSGDLLNFFTPSAYNPFYKFLISQFSDNSAYIAKFLHFLNYSWYKFTYPGIIILFIYLYILIQVLRKNISKKLLSAIKPHLFIGVFFAILTLGPFLKVFNRFMVVLEEGIPVVFPLPFLLLHYIPGFATVRGPTRFVVVFIFLSCIVAAYVINHLYRKLPDKKRFLMFLFLFIFFIFDQFYMIPKRPTYTIPTKAYEYVKKDLQQSTVLQIPFSVRDGLYYIGDVYGTSISKGALIHNKSIIGGYLSRISPDIFTYYKNLPFIGHLALIIDKGNYNFLLEKPKEPTISSFNGDIVSMLRETDFLDIKYILLKENERYTNLIQNQLRKMNYMKVMQDEDYILYQRELTKTEFISIDFGTKEDYLYTGEGFSLREDGFRWSEDNIAKIFMKTYDSKKSKLSFEAESFFKPQDVKVFLNNKYLGTKNISTQKNKYSVDVSNRLDPGLNTIIFKFSQNHKPAEVLPNNRDERNLAIKFYSLKID